MGGRGSPTVAQELEEGADPFQESVVRFHLAMTDARLADGPAAQQAALRRVFEELGAMRAELYVAGGGGGGAAVQEEMLADCERKAGEVMLNLLRKATAAVAPDPEAAPGLFYECVRLRQEAKVGGLVGWWFWVGSGGAFPSLSTFPLFPQSNRLPPLPIYARLYSHKTQRRRPTSTAASSSGGCRRRQTRRSRRWTPCGRCGGCSSARATARRRTRTSTCVPFWLGWLV